LAKNFADQEIGAVVGNLTITPGESLLSKMNHSFYKFFRQTPRIWESAIDSASFWSGELCAFRKSLLGRIEEDIVNDDRYILLKIRSKGYRAICDPKSRVYEHDAEDAQGQVIHRRRTTAGTIQGTLRFKHLLFNRKYGWFGMLVFPSHLLRVVLLPMLLLVVQILAPVAVLNLWSPNGPMWLAAGVMTLFLACLFEAGRKLLSSLFYSIIVQIAVLAGLIDYITKKHTVLWIRVPKRW